MVYHAPVMETNGKQVKAANMGVYSIAYNAVLNAAGVKYAQSKEQHLAAHAVGIKAAAAIDK